MYKLQSLDQFAEGPSFKLKLGQEKLVTFTGALLTILLNIITGVFLYSKIMVLYYESDVTIVSNLAEGALTFDDKFSAEQGLFVAAALTAYDGETEIVEEPRYGELVIQHFSWGNVGSLESSVEDLVSHPCSEQELGLSTSLAG